MAEWRWEPITDDLLDGLPPDAFRAVEQLGKELAVRESMVFLDGPAFTGDPPSIRTGQTNRGPLASPARITAPGAPALGLRDLGERRSSVSDVGALPLQHAPPN